MYLDHCVNTMGNKEAAIHNYLLSLFARQPDEKNLLHFIEDQTSRSSLPHFDLRYALRVCMRERKERACIHIYSAMKLYEEAVELALTVSVESGCNVCWLKAVDNGLLPSTGGLGAGPGSGKVPRGG